MVKNLPVKLTHIVLLILLVWAAYWNSLHNAFVADDKTLLSANNPLFLFLKPWFHSLPRFLVSLSNIFIINVCGKEAVFLRLPNIFFHLGAVLTAYFFMRRVITPQAAFFACGIFSVHPLGAEAVAWISGRAYVQYGFFLMAALLLYSLSWPASGPLPRKHRVFYAASFAGFLLALASCEKAVAFPLLLIAYIYCFGNIKKQRKSVIAYFAVSLVIVLAYLLLIKDIGSIAEAVLRLRKLEIYNPLIQIPVSLTSYLQLIFWPKELTLYHPGLTFGWPEYLVRACVFIIFMGITIYAFKQKRGLFFWLAFFVINLLPSLIPIGIFWVVAERYAYLASLGIFAVIALALDRLRKIKRLGPAVYFIYICIIAALLIRTFIRNNDWKTEDSLWIATARTSPLNPNAHNNLGDVYSRRGDLADAAKEFIRATELDPGYSEAYHNLASTYLAMGKFKQAEDAYKIAISLKPGLWQSYQDLSVLYFRTGNIIIARDSAIKAIAINPSAAKLHLNLALIYLELGETEKAVEEFRAALKLDPENHIAQKRLRQLREKGFIR